MAQPAPSKTSNTASTSAPSVQQGSTETLDTTYYDQPVVRTSQDVAYYTGNTNTTKVFGCDIQTCCKCFATLLALEGMIILGLGIGLLVYQHLQRKKDSSGEPGAENYLHAWVFAGAFFTCRGTVYLFSSVFLGISVIKPYLSGCRCWVISHGTFVACAWIVTVSGAVVYATTLQIKLEFIAPMILCLIDFYGLYVVWLYTKEIEAAEYVKMTLEDMQRRYGSASNYNSYVPAYGLEIASSESYQVIMNENLKENPDQVENDKGEPGKNENKGPEKNPGDESQPASSGPGKGPVNKGQPKGGPQPTSKGNDNKNKKPPGPAPNPAANKPPDNKTNKPQGPSSSPPPNKPPPPPPPPAAEPKKASGSSEPPKEKVGWNTLTGTPNNEEEDAAAAAARERRHKKVPKTKSLRRSFE